MKSIWDSMAPSFSEALAFAPRIAAALIVVGLAMLFGRALSKGVTKQLERREITPTHRLFFRNFALWFIVILGLVAALGILGLETALAGFLAGSGVAAIVLGFAFREIGENLLAGLFLLFSRPFEVGDFIRSDAYSGEVREIELRYTHIRTADGRDIYIPNAQIFNKPLVNFTRDGLRRPSFVIGIDYGDDVDRARELLQDTVKQSPSVLAEPEPTVNIATLAPQYVELDVSFWINSFDLSAGRSESRIEQEDNLVQIRSNVMDRCRKILLSKGFTVSANISTNISVDGAGSSAA